MSHLVLRRDNEVVAAAQLRKIDHRLGIVALAGVLPDLRVRRPAQRVDVTRNQPEVRRIVTVVREGGEEVQVTVTRRGEKMLAVTAAQTPGAATPFAELALVQEAVVAALLR